MEDMLIKPTEFSKAESNIRRNLMSHRAAIIQKMEMTTCISLTSDFEYEGFVRCKYNRDSRYPPVKFSYLGKYILGITINGKQLDPAEVFKNRFVTIPYGMQNAGDNEILIYFKNVTAKTFKGKISKESTFIFTEPDRGTSKIMPKCDCMIREEKSQFMVFTPKDWKILFSAEKDCEINAGTKDTIMKMIDVKAPKAFFSKIQHDSVLHVYKMKENKVAEDYFYYRRKREDPFLFLAGQIDSIDVSGISFIGRSDTLKSLKSSIPKIEKIAEHGIKYYEKLFDYPCPIKKLKFAFLPQKFGKPQVSGDFLVVGETFFKTCEPEEFAANLLEIIVRFWMEEEEGITEFLVYLAITEEPYLREHYYGAVINAFKAFLRLTQAKRDDYTLNRFYSLFHHIELLNLVGTEKYTHALRSFIKDEMDDKKSSNSIFHYLDLENPDIPELKSEQRYGRYYSNIKYTVMPIMEFMENKIAKFQLKSPKWVKRYRCDVRPGVPVHKLNITLYYDDRVEHATYTLPERQQEPYRYNRYSYDSCDSYGNEIPKKKPEKKEETEKPKTIEDGLDVPSLVGKPAPRAVFINSGGTAFLCAELDNQSKEWFLKNTDKIINEVDKLLILETIKYMKRISKEKARKKKRRVIDKARRKAKKAQKKAMQQNLVSNPSAT